MPFNFCIDTISIFYSNVKRKLTVSNISQFPHPFPFWSATDYKSRAQHHNSALRYLTSSFSNNSYLLVFQLYIIAVEFFYHRIGQNCIAWYRYNMCERRSYILPFTFSKRRPHSIYFTAADSIFLSQQLPVIPNYIFYADNKLSCLFFYTIKRCRIYSQIKINT